MGKVQLTTIEIDRIIEMAWEDRTPFEAIKFQFGLAEADVKVLMKKELKFNELDIRRLYKGHSSAGRYC